MKKTIIIVVSFGVLLLGMAFFYYFVVYLPQKNQANEKQYIFSMNQKCQETGTKIYKERDTGVGYLVPRFTYNKELNTCLYAEQEVGSVVIYRAVIDMFTNETIIFHTRDTKTGELIAGLPLNEYIEREGELFNE